MMWRPIGRGARTLKPFSNRCFRLMSITPPLLSQDERKHYGIVIGSRPRDVANHRFQCNSEYSSPLREVSGMGYVPRAIQIYELGIIFIDGSTAIYLILVAMTAKIMMLVNVDALSMTRIVVLIFLKAKSSRPLGCILHHVSCSLEHVSHGHSDVFHRY